MPNDRTSTSWRSCSRASGMPDRDYYLKDDAKFADTRAKYRDYVETMLKLAAYPEAAANADAIVAVERQIAELHWPREKSRDRDLTYNPKIAPELMAFAPGISVGGRAAVVRRAGAGFLHRRSNGRGSQASRSSSATRRSRPGAPT